MKKLLPIICALWALQACNKTGFTENKSLGQGSPSISTAGVGINIAPANTNNPFDSAGAWHNRLLSLILEQVHAKRDSSATSVHSAAVKAALSLGVHLPDKSAINAVAVVSDVANRCASIIGKIPVSTHAKEALAKLAKLLCDTTDVASKGYAAIKGRIVLFENEVSHDNQLAANEKACILGATSVARHSFYFWLRQATPVVDTAPAARPFNILRFFCVGITDVFGFVVSSATGGDGSGLAGAAAAGAEASADGNNMLNYVPGNIFN